MEDEDIAMAIIASLTLKESAVAPLASHPDAAGPGDEGEPLMIPSPKSDEPPHGGPALAPEGAVPVAALDLPLHLARHELELERSSQRELEMALRLSMEAASLAEGSGAGPSRFQVDSYGASSSSAAAGGA